MKRRFVMVVCACLVFFSVSAQSHSGRTDANGGHWDHSTGTYHYHNGSSSSSSTNAKSSSKTPVYKYYSSSSTTTKTTSNTKDTNKEMNCFLKS